MSLSGIGRGLGGVQPEQQTVVSQDAKQRGVAGDLPDVDGPFGARRLGRQSTVKV